MLKSAISPKSNVWILVKAQAMTNDSSPIVAERFNPLMPNAFPHPFYLNESISNLRVVGWCF